MTPHSRLSRQLDRLIENQVRLTNHGFRSGRQTALDIVTYALKKVNARQALLDKVRLAQPFITR